MEIIEITGSNFEKEVLQSDEKVLVDFYANWCGPCKMLSPIIDEIAKENKNIKVVKVNVDDNQELAEQYDIMSIPTTVVIKDSKVINRKVGVISKSEILEMIK